MPHERYFSNPFQDYKPGVVVQKDNAYLLKLIDKYLQNFISATPQMFERSSSIYTGHAGIAYMFLCLHQSACVPKNNIDYLDYAYQYIQAAKKCIHKRPDKYGFLCGSSGVFAVSAVIESCINSQSQEVKDDLECYLNASDHMEFDEMLVGRAGYVQGAYWLNDKISSKPVKEDIIVSVLERMVTSGQQYGKQFQPPLPLMYQYHGTEYLGAAHGLSHILLMLLDSPLHNNSLKVDNPSAIGILIKQGIDFMLNLQEADGNFPVAFEDLRSKREKRLVHWCHGGPGVIFLMAKAYLYYKEQKYLDACLKIGDLVWTKGLLKKGPGFCHGVSGNAYTFIILFRLTKDEKHLYRALKFTEFLSSPEFLSNARTPDCPLSLYEGIAGTVCFLVDLLNVNNADFIFSNIFLGSNM